MLSFRIDNITVDGDLLDFTGINDNDFICQCGIGYGLVLKFDMFFKTIGIFVYATASRRYDKIIACAVIESYHGIFAVDVTEIDKMKILIGSGFDSG